MDEAAKQNIRVVGHADSRFVGVEAATKNPSMFLGTIDKAGTIEKGKRANLILLNANPLDDISATENRAGVMLKGKMARARRVETYGSTKRPKRSRHRSKNTKEYKNRH